MARCFVLARRMADAVIMDSTFMDNVVAVNGAGVFQEDTAGSVTNCVFKGNKALVRAGESIL